MSTPIKINLELAKQIQLYGDQRDKEGYERGLREALAECKPENEDYSGGSTGSARGTRNAIRQAIFSHIPKQTGGEK